MIDILSNLVSYWNHYPGSLFYADTHGHNMALRRIQRCLIFLPEIFIRCRLVIKSHLFGIAYIIQDFLHGGNDSVFCFHSHRYHLKSAGRGSTPLRSNVEKSLLERLDYLTGLRVHKRYVFISFCKR